MAKRNIEIEETEEEIELTENVNEYMPTVLEAKEKVVEPVLIDDSKVYKAEVIVRFGKTSVGSRIEKKGSIIKVLLDKKLIKLI